MFGPPTRILGHAHPSFREKAAPFRIAGCCSWWPHGAEPNRNEPHPEGTPTPEAEDAALVAGRDHQVGTRRSPRALLRLAGEAWDRCQAARQRIDAEGLTITTVQGMKVHPCVRIELENRTAFTRLIRELDLDLEAPAASKRPPSLRSVR